MGRDSYLYTNHAVRQMFSRGISTAEVQQVIEQGEVINEYPDDHPFPSKLIFAFCEGRPLHVVCSVDQEQKKIIITTYEPSLDLWEGDFKTKRE